MIGAQAEVGAQLEFSHPFRMNDSQHSQRACLLNKPVLAPNTVECTAIFVCGNFYNAAILMRYMQDSHLARRWCCAIIASLLNWWVILDRTRRSFISGVLQGAAFVGGSLILPNQSLATGNDDDFWSQPRELWLSRPESGDAARVLYWADGAFVSSGYVHACKILRDIHVNQAVQMLPGLLNLLFAIQETTHRYYGKKILNINSGFRTKVTNENTEGSARNSLHMYGAACDLRVQGVPTDKLWQIAAYFRAGGVGYYPVRKFIHVDVGRKHYWAGR